MISEKEASKVIFKSIHCQYTWASSYSPLLLPLLSQTRLDFLIHHFKWALGNAFNSTSLWKHLNISQHLSISEPCVNSRAYFLYSHTRYSVHYQRRSNKQQKLISLCIYFFHPSVSTRFSIHENSSIFLLFILSFFLETLSDILNFSLLANELRLPRINSADNFGCYFQKIKAINLNFLTFYKDFWCCILLSSPTPVIIEAVFYYFLNYIPPLCFRFYPFLPCPGCCLK